jgi:hypothetical protein
MIKTNVSYRFFVGLLVGVFFYFYLIIPAFSEDVTLGWDPNGEPGVAGYGVYLGTEASPEYELYGYVDILDLEDPQSPSFTVTGLTAGEVYAIALTAYNAAGDESGFSAPVCLEAGTGPVECSSLAADAPSEGGSEVASSGGGGGGGGGCFVWAAAEPTQDQNALSPLSLVAVWFLSGLTVLVGCRRFALLFKISKSSK